MITPLVRSTRMFNTSTASLAASSLVSAGFNVRFAKVLE